MMGTDAELTDPPTPDSTGDLQLTRERSRTDVNRFLKRHHPRGGVPGWLACFGARFQGHLVACVVLERPSARMLDDGTVVEVTRFAIREDRPSNTGSRLIARGRRWAELEGYDRIISYAGVAGNKGIVYQAAGFNCADVSTADGSGWKSRVDRDSWSDYQRRRYEYNLGDVEAVGDE